MHHVCDLVLVDSTVRLKSQQRERQTCRTPNSLIRAPPSPTPWGVKVSGAMRMQVHTCYAPTGLVFALRGGHSASTGCEVQLTVSDSVQLHGSSPPPKPTALPTKSRNHPNDLIERTHITNNSEQSSHVSYKFSSFTYGQDGTNPIVIEGVALPSGRIWGT
eukprot:4616033-Amphidinium_carterae.1